MNSKKDKVVYQLSKIGNKYMWTGTLHLATDHHMESDDRYFYTTDKTVRDEMNMKPINK